MKSSRPLEFEDLYEVVREVHQDLKDEMDSGLHDAQSELALAGQILLLKYLGVRLQHRFDATKKATNEFTNAVRKAGTPK